MDTEAGGCGFEADQTQQAGVEADNTQEAEVIDTWAGGYGFKGDKTQEVEVVDTGTGASGFEADQTQEAEVVDTGTGASSFEAASILPAANDNTPVVCNDKDVANDESVKSNSVSDNGQEAEVVDTGADYSEFEAVSILTAVMDHVPDVVNDKDIGHNESVKSNSVLDNGEDLIENYLILDGEVVVEECSVNVSDQESTHEAVEVVEEICEVTTGCDIFYVIHLRVFYSIPCIYPVSLQIINCSIVFLYITGEYEYTKRNGSN